MKNASVDPFVCAMVEVGPLSGGGIGVPEVEGRGVLKDLFQDVGQLVLPQVPVDGLGIDSNEHCFLDGPSNTVCFPAHDGKAVYIDRCPVDRLNGK